MSGPFSSETIERILQGLFQSSPLIISIQSQGPGEPDKLRVCQHLSKTTKTTPSVNSFISKQGFPTQFDMASHVADVISSYLRLILVVISYPRLILMVIPYPRLILDVISYPRLILEVILSYPRLILEVI